MCSPSDPLLEFPVLEVAICGAAAPPAASEAVFLAEDSILGAEMSSLCLKETTGASDSSVPRAEIVELLDSNTGAVLIYLHCIPVFYIRIDTTRANANLA